MTVQDFTQILRTRWKLICGVIVLVLLGALGYSLLATPQYQASTRLFVSTTSDGTNTQTNDGGLFAQRRVLSYTQLLTGGILAQRTIDKLGLDMTAAQLQGEVTAVAPTDTVLIDVTVLDPSPVRARDIANTLSDEFVVMAAGLETPDLGARPNAQVVVQQRAAVPDSPVTPKTTRNLAIAVVLGAVLGVLAAIIRDRLDDTVRRLKTVEETSGVGVIGEIPAEGTRRHGPVVTFGSGDSTTADAFRELRINLQSLQVADGPKALLVASPGAGEGRTTTAINLALALTEAGSDVLIVDGNLRHPQIAASLGVAAEPGLSTVLTGGAPLNSALHETRFPRLTALSAGSVPPNPTELLGSSTAKDAFGEMSRQFDYVIVDSPPLTVKDAALLAVSVHGVLVVVRFGRTKRRQLADTVTVLRRAGAPLLGAVVTMMPATKGDRIDGGHQGGGRRRRRALEK
ncbi:polysaccharide biosynthesis tyrosine autokinase [Mycolicibacterium chubuense]|uniref:polysaccharide biosynthesis tyrosine autokinase n=1 Tax=Mycolicibacterium chubuense TaxID=1800 RepID=UPI000301E02E|nr:polysaccharide biosynthesis tyrosine autokinase [Mycolicibacterium chubuense]